MKDPVRLTQSTRCRVMSMAAGVVLLVFGVALEGLGGLLLVMAGLVPIGAAIANVAMITSTREVWRHWASVGSRRAEDRETPQDEAGLPAAEHHLAPTK